MIYVLSEACGQALLAQQWVSRRIICDGCLRLTSVIDGIGAANAELVRLRSRKVRNFERTTSLQK